MLLTACLEKQMNWEKMEFVEVIPSSSLQFAGDVALSGNDGNEV